MAFIDHLINREAQLMAYSDTFLIAGVAMLLCAIATLALRKRRT
jgi:MFS transporter, DHA2 family, multidrug resistance protein